MHFIARKRLTKAKNLVPLYFRGLVFVFIYKAIKSCFITYKLSDDVSQYDPAVQKRNKE